MSAPIITKALLESITDRIIEIVLDKNHDYGDAWAVHAPAGVLLRMFDKIMRIQVLDGRRQLLVVSESARDTLADLIGYSLLLLAFLEETNANQD